MIPPLDRTKNTSLPPHCSDLSLVRGAQLKVQILADLSGWDLARHTCPVTHSESLTTENADAGAETDVDGAAYHAETSFPFFFQAFVEETGNRG